MNAITVRAATTQKAMDQLLRRLGPDALILSTRIVGGEVEVAALPPDASPPPPKMAGEPANFAQAFQREASRKVSADPLTALARRLFLPEGLDDEPVTRVLIVGPPGAGKSMLAARLAAQVMLIEPGIRPHVIAPTPSALLVEDRLRGWLRLMGLMPDRPTVAQVFNLPDPPIEAPQIVDLSDVADNALALSAKLIECDGAELILCLPAGLHPARVAKLCHDWQPFAATVTLTGLDQWWPERAELDAIAEAGLKLTRTTAGTGLVRALSRPGASDLNRWASGWAPSYAGAAE